jgi:hypothetical protein
MNICVICLALREVIEIGVAQLSCEKNASVNIQFILVSHALYNLLRANLKFAKSICWQTHKRCIAQSIVLPRYANSISRLKLSSHR